MRIRVSLFAGLVAVTSFTGLSLAQSKVTAAPTFNAVTVGNTTTLPLADATYSTSLGTTALTTSLNPAIAGAQVIVGVPQP